MFMFFCVYFSFFILFNLVIFSWFYQVRIAGIQYWWQSLLQQFGRPKLQFIVFWEVPFLGMPILLLLNLNFFSLAANLLLPINLCTVELSIFMGGVLPLWECCILIGSCNILWLMVFVQFMFLIVFSLQ